MSTKGTFEDNIIINENNNQMPSVSEQDYNTNKVKDTVGSTNKKGTSINFSFLSPILYKIKGILEAYKEIAYTLPKIFLDASLAAVGLVFVFVSNAPVFMIGGGILALASICYTVAGAWKFVKSIMKTKATKTMDSIELVDQGKGIPEWLNFLAPSLLSFGLLCFGILAFFAPALLGMTELSLVFKICSLVASAAFAGKASVNILLANAFKSSPKINLIGKWMNGPSNVLIYGTGLVLGISVLVLNGALTPISVVFTLIFALRTVASVLDVFGKNDSTEGVGRVARFLKSISFAVSAVSLGAAAIFFAPAVAFGMGVTASFVQIAGGIGGLVCLFAAIMKFMFGFGSSSELKFSPCHKIFVEASLKIDPENVSSISMNILKKKKKMNEFNKEDDKDSQGENTSQEPIKEIKEIKMEEEETKNQNDLMGA